MMEMMNKNKSEAAPAAPAPSAAPDTSTREGIQQAIDALDMRFMNGEISEDNYNRLMSKWQERLNNFE